MAWEPVGHTVEVALDDAVRMAEGVLYIKDSIMIYSLLSIDIVLQLICGIHAYKSGRYQWIYIILLFPLVGCLLYLILEVLPDMRSVTAHVTEKTEQVILPNARMQRLKEAVEICDSVDNRMTLAEAYMQQGQYAEALEQLKIYEQGPFKDDSRVQSQLALCYHMAHQPEKALGALARIRKPDGQFENQSYHLLLAMALDKAGRIEDAKKEFELLTRYFIGEEARCQYGLLLIRNGELEKAKAVFNSVMQRHKSSPRFYRNENQKWFELAKKELTLI